MVNVRMLIHRTGSRYDGRDWPPFHGIIDLPEEEAAGLVREKLAEYQDAPQLDRGYDVLKVATPGYEVGLQPVDGEEEDPRYMFHSHGRRDPHVTGLVDDSDYDNDFDRADYDNDFDRDEPEPPPVKRPYANANKAEWVNYVVEKGYISYGDAKNLTKAALMEMDS